MTTEELLDEISGNSELSSLEEQKIEEYLFAQYWRVIADASGGSHEEVDTKIYEMIKQARSLQPS